MYIKVNLHLDCYSVGAAEDFAVREQQTKFQTAVSLWRPRGSTGFMQYLCLAESELLKDMYILHVLATKMESRPESFPIHFPIGGRRLTF